MGRKNKTEKILFVMAIIGIISLSVGLMTNNWYCFIIGVSLMLIYSTWVNNQKKIEEKERKKINDKIHTERKKKRQAEIEKKEAERQARHPRYISVSIKREVWRRDKGECVECSSNLRLEYDHIIPFSKGGSNTVRNIQLLCENCNRKKSNNI